MMLFQENVHEEISLPQQILEREKKNSRGYEFPNNITVVYIRECHSRNNQFISTHNQTDAGKK